MSYKKGPLIYEGKAKRVHSDLNVKNVVWLEFKDTLTAFNGEKVESLLGKGAINLAIAEQVFQILDHHQIHHHCLKVISKTEMVCQSLNMIPLEVVIRNRLAGSTAKKFNINDGTNLEVPLLEFFYKEDSLGDPFINDEQALMLKAVDHADQLKEIKSLAYKVNMVLLHEFKKINIDLVDFKIEMGWDTKGNLCLGDEITPDCCRLWDKESGEIFDKDRFRKNLGQVLESYQKVLDRLRHRSS